VTDSDSAESPPMSRAAEAAFSVSAAAGSGAEVSRETFGVGHASAADAFRDTSGRPSAQTGDVSRETRGVHAVSSGAYSSADTDDSDSEDACDFHGDDARAPRSAPPWQAESRLPSPPPPSRLAAIGRGGAPMGECGRADAPVAGAPMAVPNAAGAAGLAAAAPAFGFPLETSSAGGPGDVDAELPDTPIAAAARQAVEVQQGDLTLPRPRKRRVFTVANQKGGVGKTTTTVNIGVALALAGLHVLVIDLDPQGNASTALGADRKAGTPSVYDVLLGEIEAAEAIQTCREAPRLGILPATIDLAGAEIELVTMESRESRLKVAIDAIKGEYDYVFIDCPPSLGLLTVNAMVATEEVLVPIQCEYYALEGLGQLLTNIALVQQHLNTGLEVSTILLTMYDGRTKLADQVANEVRRHFQDKVLRTVIPRSVKVSEAPGFGQSVITYDAGSRGAMSYLDAAREIAHRGARPLSNSATPSGTSTSSRSAADTAGSPAGVTEGDMGTIVQVSLVSSGVNSGALQVGASNGNVPTGGREASA